MKVFGLGLSKTGTSSLAEALNQLGLRTIHYPSDESTFDGLRSGRYRLPILEEYQGAVDIPIAPFYPQLDAEYPGSRFILTIRDPESWLRSVELHWELMMDWWHRYPDFKRFQEFISERVYGSVEFDRERFLHAYETHRKSVECYFKDRPDDLLVLDVCGGEGWERLCPFLGVEAPEAPFPHANEWMHQLLAATAELQSIVPPGEFMVLIDQDSFGKGFAEGRRTLPFTAREGQYWGPPANGAEAVAELIRAGARYVVVGWPAFWWLDFYPELRTHLNKHFACVLDTDRLKVFAARPHPPATPAAL
ncbi:MAG TPA: sulfotransferase [Thermoanaerobaculia bacterium]|nr:sulfotransferase [Thermoanaerobaculia bacterium]